MYTHAPLDPFASLCSKCERPHHVRGPTCRESHSYLFLCSICNLSVKGKPCFPCLSLLHLLHSPLSLPSSIMILSYYWSLLPYAYLYHTGSSNFCLACGHGGHIKHMLEWFSKDDLCPAGCGCRCLDLSAWT